MQTFAFLFTPMPAIIFLVPILLVAIVLLVAINKTKTLDTVSPAAVPLSPSATLDQAPTQTSVVSGALVDTVQLVTQTAEASAAITIPVVSENVATPPQEAVAQIAVGIVSPVVGVVEEIVANPLGQPTQSVEVVTEPILTQVSESIQPVEVAVITETQAVEAPVVEPVVVSFRPADPSPSIDSVEDRPFAPSAPEQVSFVPEATEEVVKIVTLPSVEEVVPQSVDSMPAVIIEESSDVQSTETSSVEPSLSSQISVPSPIVARASSRLRPVF
jgi:hypothetical protein